MAHSIITLPRRPRSRRRCHGLIMAAALALAPPAIGGLIIHPPSVATVGPDAACDYPTLQQAIDEETRCGPFCLPPLGGRQFRLSDAYSHSGDVTISDPLAVIGGYDSCGAPSNGGRKILSGIKVLVGNSGSGSISVNLVNLELIGTSSLESRGGVIEMTGAAALTLSNSTVASGNAIQGGGIAMQGAGNRLMLDGTTVWFNTAVEEGGGIWCTDFGVIDFVSGSVRNNETDRRGGGLYLDGCRLYGDAPFTSRRIQLNTVRRSDPGKGAGVYLTGSARLEMGALMSRTLIDRNLIKQNPEVTAFGDAIGGGIHAEDATVILRNSHVTGNVAPAGAAISSGAGSVIDIDRLAGPCPDGTAPSGQSECSLIAGNITSGRRSPSSESDAWRSGLGVVFYGFAKSWKLRRTTVRDNRADCEGGCGEPSGSLVQVNGNSSGTVFRLEGSLIVDNFLDATCGFFCDLQPNANNRNGLFSIREYEQIDLIGNTVVRNRYKDSTDNDVKDFLMRTDGEWSAIGNIVHDNEIEDLMDQNTSYIGGTGTLIEATCNVTDYQSLLDDAEFSQANVLDDPLILDPASGDYRIPSNSPAVNRCDEVMGAFQDTYDVAGRFRPRDHGETQTSLDGYHDAGALENQLFAPDEVDLAVSLARDSTAEPPGAVFEATVTNNGATPAQAGNFSLRFFDPGTVTQLDTSWNCAGQGGTMTCSLDFLNSLQPGATTAPIELEVRPDASGECSVQIEALSGNQTDIDAANNSRQIRVRDCSGPETIFSSSFESP